MKHFDIYKFFMEAEMDEEEQVDPNAQMQQPDPQMQMPQPQPEQDQAGEEGSPEQQTKEMKNAESKTVFSDFAGKTVKKVDFKHVGTNSGEVKIYFKEFGNSPMVISWTNDKVTVTKPPGGDIYPLT